MPDGDKSKIQPNEALFEEMNEAIANFCEDFNLVLTNKAIRLDRPLIFCEFTGEMGKIHMFIEKRGDKITIAAEVDQSYLM